MLTIRQKTMAIAVLLVVLAGLRAVQAQPPRTGRGETRGLVKAVDAGAGTITLTLARGREASAEKTYSLSKQVEVGVAGPGGRRAFRQIKLTDLAPGAWASLALSADGKTVEAILAEGPQVRGVLKSVDAEKKTLTVALAPTRREEAGEEKTFTVDASTEVGLDDGRARRFSIKEAKLADLPVGALVTLGLSIDQKQVHSVVAEGPNLFASVKTVDAGKKTLTLVIRQRSGEAEEKTLTVAPNAVTLLDDGLGRRFSLREGKLADVLAGAAVLVKLSPDQKLVTLIQAAGPSFGGRLKAVDAKKGTISIDVQLARGENPEEKTFSIGKDVRILIDGKPAKLGDLMTGDGSPFAMLRLSLDQKTVQAITVGRPRERN